MRHRTIAASAALLVTVLGCATLPSASLESNKDLVRQFTEATNAADWDALAQIVAEDFTRHSAATEGPPISSLDEFVALQEAFLDSFPDQRVVLQQLIAEGDFVAIRATYSGTQLGPIGELPATGKSVQAPFLAVLRVDSGRIAELWVEWDNVAMLRQLGLPSPPPASE